MKEEKWDVNFVIKEEDYDFMFEMLDLAEKFDLSVEANVVTVKITLPEGFDINGGGADTH